MEAYQLTEFDGPDALERTEVPAPEPGPNEIRVRVHATTVNPVDAKVCERGDAWGSRLR